VALEGDRIGGSRKREPHLVLFEECLGSVAGKKKSESHALAEEERKREKKDESGKRRESNRLVTSKKRNEDESLKKSLVSLQGWKIRHSYLNPGKEKGSFRKCGQSEGSRRSISQKKK